MRLAEDIDRGSTMVDVVNVAHIIGMDEKKDYLVLSLVDDGTEFPLPLGAYFPLTCYVFWAKESI